MLWMRSNKVKNIAHSIEMHSMLHVPIDAGLNMYATFILLFIYVDLIWLDWMGYECTQTLRACTVSEWMHAYIRTHTRLSANHKRWVMCVCCREKTSSLSSRLAQLRRRNKCFFFAYPNGSRGKKAKKFRSQCEQQNKRSEEHNRKEEKKVRKIEKRQR